MPHDVAVILNNCAGHPDASALCAAPGLVRDAFAKHGRTASVVAHPPPEVPAAVRDALRSGAHIIVIGGGDGTVSAGAAELVDREAALGVLPLGTLNHLAKDLRLPLEWPAAVEAIAHGRTRRIDVAEVNGRPFINNCSIGAYPEAVRRRQAARSRHGLDKRAAMLLATWQTMGRLKRMHVTLERAEGVLVRHTPFVLVANNRYQGRLFDGASRDRLDAGELWYYTTREHRLFPLLRMVVQSLVRGLEQTDHLDSGPAAQLTLRFRTRKIPAGIDGEIVPLESPLRFRIRPASLQVLAPPAT